MFISFEWHLFGLLASMVAVFYNVRRGTWEWKSIPAHLFIIYLGPIALLVVVTIFVSWVISEIQHWSKRRICLC